MQNKIVFCFYFMCWSSVLYVLRGNNVSFCCGLVYSRGTASTWGKAQSIMTLVVL